MSKLFIPSPPTLAGLQVSLSASGHFTGSISPSPNHEVALDLNGAVLREPSSICRFVGAPLIPAELEALAAVDEWIDYNVSLSSLVNDRSVPALREALRKLDGALSNSSHLTGSKLTLADVVVFASLFPVLCSKGGSLHEEAPTKVRGWFGEVEKQPTVAQGLSSLKVTCAQDVKLGQEAVGTGKPYMPQKEKPVAKEAPAKQSKDTPKQEPSGKKEKVRFAPQIEQTIEIPAEEKADGKQEKAGKQEQNKQEKAGKQEQATNKQEKGAGKQEQGAKKQEKAPKEQKVPKEESVKAVVPKDEIALKKAAEKEAPENKQQTKAPSKEEAAPKQAAKMEPAEKGKKASSTSSQPRQERDVSWNPVVPPGHTPFSWRVAARGFSSASAPAASSSSSSSSSSSAKPASDKSALSDKSASKSSSAKPASDKSAASVKPSSAAEPSSSSAVSSSSGSVKFRDETPRVRLPEEGKKNVLITSALPYVNNVPHLGNIIGCVLSADAYSRYCRLRGWNSVYVCGTDEYGTATETKAIEANLTPQQICDKFYKIHKEIYEWFDIKFDKFGRTTTKFQTIIAQDIFNKCQANGYVHEQDVTQLWCQEYGFLADRFVYGICPKCSYDDARGDQCDKCGQLLNAVELINPKAKLNPAAKVTTKTSKHLFLDLPGLLPNLTEFVDRSSAKGKWSANSIATTNGWIRDGLKARCITRDLKWGTPVPCVGYEDKVFYVWFDAPIGYLSITNSYTDQWERWWKNPENVELVQFMGKDNIPFHTVIFPCSLLGTKENYTLLHHINTTEYLNYEQGKFSKSRGVGVFGDDAKASGIDSSVWRYYLFVNRPEVSDSIFTWTDFSMKNNTELLANLGNFVNRILSFLKTRLGGVVPAVHPDQDQEFIKLIQSRITNYVTMLDAVKLKDAIREAMSLSGDGNRFMQENEPWRLAKEGNQERCAAVLGLCVNLVYWLAILFEPFMPACSQKILKQLNFGIVENALASDRFVCHIPAGHVIGEPELLFRRLEEKEVEQLRSKHAGTQDERNAAVLGPKLVLDIRAGKINKVEDHPAADAPLLYVLTIDVGEEKDRTVVSGLKPNFKPEELQGRNVLVICNGKDFEFKGVTSKGMVLTAEKSKAVELLSVDAPVGTAIVPTGGTVEIVPNFDLRSTFKKLDIKVDKEGNVLFVNSALMAGSAAVKTKLGAGAKVK